MANVYTDVLLSVTFLNTINYETIRSLIQEGFICAVTLACPHLAGAYNKNAHSCMTKMATSGAPGIQKICLLTFLP